MLNREDDYLTSKLRQLKSSVLGNQPAPAPRPDKSPLRDSSQLQGTPSPANQSLQYETLLQLPKVGGMLTLGSPDVVPPAPRPILKKSQPGRLPPGIPIKLYGNTSMRMTLDEYETKTQANNQRIFQQVIGNPEVRRPRSQEIIEDMRTSYMNRMAPVVDRPPEFAAPVFSGPPLDAHQKATTAAFPSFPSHVLSKSTEPIRSVHAKNPLNGLLTPNATSFYQSPDNSALGYDPRPRPEAPKSTQLGESTVASSTEKFGLTLPIKSVPVTTQYISTNSDPTHVRDPTNLLESINLQKQSASDAATLQFIEQTNRRIIDIINRNNQLVQDIADLKKQLAKEKEVTLTTNTQLQAELKHVMAAEDELVRHMNSVQGDLQAHSRRRIDIGGQSTELTQQYERLLHQNEVLRGDLKRMGELSASKILDLENGINSIARMRVLEVENHSMEKEKLTNHADFVCEQIRVQFNERSGDIDAEIELHGKQKARIDADLKSLQADLAGFNQTADQRINNEMTIAIQRETDRQERERQAIQNQVDEEEHAVRELNQLLEAGVQKMGRLEADARNRLGSKRADNLRLREQLQNDEAAYKRCLLQLTNERNNYERKGDEIYHAKEELQEVAGRVALLNSRLDAEVNGLTRDGQQQSKAMEEQILRLEERERELVRAITAEKERIAQLMHDQQQAVSLVESTLAKALILSTAAKQTR